MYLSEKLGTTGLNLTLPAIFALAFILSGAAESGFSKLVCSLIVGACLGFYIAAAWVS